MYNPDKGPEAVGAGGDGITGAGERGVVLILATA